MFSENINFPTWPVLVAAGLLDYAIGFWGMAMCVVAVFVFIGLDWDKQ